MPDGQPLQAGMSGGREIGPKEGGLNVGQHVGWNMCRIKSRTRASQSLLATPTPWDPLSSLQTHLPALRRTEVRGRGRVAHRDLGFSRLIYIYIYIYIYREREREKFILLRLLLLLLLIIIILIIITITIMIITIMIIIIMITQIMIIIIMRMIMTPGRLRWPLMAVLSAA